MRVRCEKCNKSYEDAYEWTICPHNPLEVGPEEGAYCRKHDLFTPCPLCTKNIPPINNEYGYPLLHPLDEKK